MMGERYVQTVIGKRSVNSLGHCQCHEHLFLAANAATDKNPALCINDYQKTVDELSIFKEKGGKTIVDAQPLGAGRMAEWLMKAAEETNLNIIASTGFHKLMFYWENHWIHHFSAEQLARLFTEEIQHGMYVDGERHLPAKRIEARAGIIKVAVDSPGIEGHYIKLFEAAAQAALTTGLPIMVHIENDSNPFDVIRFLTERGISPASIILCHLDRTHHDYALHKEIAQTGVFLEYDTIGRFKYHSDEAEAALVHHMIEQGFEDSLLISLDTTRQRLKSYGGEIGLDYIFEFFINTLKQKGIDEHVLNKLTTTNAKRALAIGPIE
jgi:phosphotriesterase-related protein